MTRTSLTLHTDVLDAIDAAVADGQALNVSAFIEAAVQEKLTRLTGARLYAAYDAAAHDPGFASDMAAVNEAFAATSADGLDARGAARDA